MAVVAAVVGPGSSAPSRGQEPPDTNYDESKVPPYELPDPLVCFDGRPVSDAATWREVRRPEILRAFAEHVYGWTPEIKTSLRFETLSPDTMVFDGLATRKQIRIRWLESDDALWIDLLLYVPNHRSGPVPVFLGLNYGNQGVDPNPGIIPSRNAVCQRGEHAHPLAIGDTAEAGLRRRQFSRRRHRAGSPRFGLPIHDRELAEGHSTLRHAAQRTD